MRTREINGAVIVGVDLVDHVLELRLGRVLAKRSHDGAQLLSGDLACADVCTISNPCYSALCCQSFANDHIGCILGSGMFFVDVS
jgi:hypothetical protein